MDQESNDTISFDLPKNQSSVIKAIGVGGGGSNAVNHMFNIGIRGVDFVICNTDSQALENSPVPNKIQLGLSLTEGLGAGANPEVGMQAAEESLEEIQNLLNTNTKMVFITAGMGGGTGTGAAPVIAKAARDLGILTVGIVTVPFKFEGKTRLEQAERGLDELRKVTDSMVVINNNKLREVYGNLGFKAGFAKADEVLSTAARGIAEVIVHHYTTNIDLRDAKTVLANSGTAVMGAARAQGEDRALKAIQGALDSPLLNDNHIRGAKNVLLLIVSGQEEITIDEIGEINEYIQSEAGGSANIIMGIGEDEKLGNEIAVTIVATGFDIDQQTKVIGRAPEKVVHTLEDDQPVSASIYHKPIRPEEDSEDDLIDQELARAERREAARRLEAKQQASLFDWPEDQTDQALPPEREISAPPQAEKKPEPAQKPEALAEEPKEEAPQEAKPRPKEPVASGDEEDFIFDIELREEKETPQPAPPQESRVSEPSPSGQKRVYQLEDYEALEQELRQAQPPAAKEAASPKAEEEDEDLRFELRSEQKSGEEKSSGNYGSAELDPMEHSIEESRRLKAEERRAKLKAFNYRFRTNPHNLDETDRVPAYKRHGIELNQERYSSSQNQSRMRLQDGEDGPDLRSNNSFLHDNVD